MTVRLTCFVSVFVLLLCATASAATPFWHSALIATDNDDLQSASCSTPTLCIAVGDNGIADVEDGAYEYLTIADQDANLPSLNSISCVPGKRFCMAVDSRGQAVPWVDGEFGDLKHVDGTFVFESVSCPTDTFCKAVDDFGKVFTYANGAWSATSAQLAGTPAQGTPRLSCATPQFCVAVAQVASGVVYYKFTGSAWSATGTGVGAAADAAPRSLVCTLATFCLLTTNKGSAARFDGNTTWTVKQVVQTVQVPIFAGCAPATTTCQAIDQNVKGYSTTDGVTWSSSTDLRSTTLSSPSSVSCLAADLCVATSGSLASAFARSIVPSSKPVVNGAGTLGVTLTVTHPPLDETRAWFRTIWWRCQDPGSRCVRATPDSSPTYTLTDVDKGTYIEARDDTGIGLDEEGSKFNPNANFVSLPLHVEDPSDAPPPVVTAPSPAPPVPVSTTPTVTPVAKLSMSVKTSKKAVTVTVKCPGPGTCKGTVKLAVGKKTLGSKRYSTPAGKQVVITLKLGKAATKLFKAHRTLKATLTVDPSAGSTLKKAVTLKR